MKKIFVITIGMLLVFSVSRAQQIRASLVAKPAKLAFARMYPSVKTVVWEKEDGNFEGNWKENGMDHSAAFTPEGRFAASETDIPVSTLPQKVKIYVKGHYREQIREASINKDAKGKVNYEADISKGRAILFDEKGDFIKAGQGD